MKLTRRDFAAGIVAGMAAPHVISSARAQAATLKIGMCAPVTGPAAESGGYAIKGAKLALEAVNKAGGVLGKQVELIIEDDQTTNPGIVLAFSKLAAQSDIVAFLGSIRSTQVHAMAPDVLKLGKPVMIGGTDPNLTHMGNQWLFRFRPNDSYSGRVIADYGVNTLGKKKWAVLHSTDAFGTAGGKALSEALEKLGAPAVLAVSCCVAPAVLSEPGVLSVGIELVPITGPEIDALIAQFPFFSTEEIPDNAYRGVAGVKTVSVHAIWTTSIKQSEELIYKVTAALWNPASRKLLDSGHAKGREIRIETAT